MKIDILSTLCLITANQFSSKLVRPHVTFFKDTYKTNTIQVTVGNGMMIELIFVQPHLLLTSTISVRCKRMPCKTIGGSRDIKPNQSHLDGWSTFHPGRLRQFRPIWLAYLAWHDWRSLCRRVQPDRTPSNIVQILNKSKNV